MIVDLYHPGLPLFCLLWKLAPNILWSVGNMDHGQLPQVRRDDLLVMLRVSLMVLLADRPAKPGHSR